MSVAEALFKLAQYGELIIPGILAVYWMDLLAVIVQLGLVVHSMRAQIAYEST